MDKKEKRYCRKIKEFSARPLKFPLQKEPGGSHVKILNSPVEIRSSQNWLWVFIGLECNKTPPFYTFKANTNYVSKNIHDIMYPLSVIEWHCNIAEYSYANHDDHPHLHKQVELLHISSVNKHFYENPVYKVSPKKIMFIPLREGLREIKGIILTPLDENSEEIKNKKKMLLFIFNWKRNEFLIGNCL